MSREYKADEYEINRLKSKLQMGSDKIIREHGDIRRSVESKLNSVLSEYGNCSSISSTVRAIRDLLAYADGDVRQMERDMDDILSGLEFTIRSTREVQQEINSIIGRMQMPIFDRLDVGGGDSYTDTSSGMLKPATDLTNDFLARSMIGGVVPVVLGAGEGVKTPSLLEQSTNIIPDINSAEEAKEYLEYVKRQGLYKEDKKPKKPKEDSGNGYFDIKSSRLFASVEMGNSVYQGQAKTADESLIEAEGELKGLYATGEARASFTMFKSKKDIERDAQSGKIGTGDSKMFQGVELMLGVSSGLAEANGEVSIGNKNIGGGVSAEGNLLSGNAEAGFVTGIDEEGVVKAGVKVEALASVASGEVGGTINLFGIEIGVGVEGHALAVGAGAEYGLADNKIEASVDVAALFGIGLNFSIGLAD